MIRFLILIATLFSLSSPAVAELFKAESFALDNGLQCVVVENHKAPIVKQMLWYKVGSVDEDFSTRGSAHLLEHLMFRGTSRLPDGEFNRVMEKNGASSNAFTSYDLTAYHQMADISRLEILLALEADRMQNLSFNEEAFLAEQKIVLQERKQVIENKPDSAFTERFNKILWGNLPYGHPVTGLSEEIMSLTYDNILNFYKQYYAPNNAILVLSGDIDVKEVRKLVEKYFGHLKKHKIIRRKPAENADMFSETLTMTLPDIQTPKMVQKFLLMPKDRLQNEIYDYLVLAEYLGGGETSFLYKELVVRQHAAVSASVNYHFVTGSNTTFHISMLPTGHSKKNIEETWSKLDKAMVQAVENLTDTKLEQVKRKMLSGLVYVNDNPEDAAYWIGYMLANGFNLGDIQNYEQRINEVTVKGVKKAFEMLQTAPTVKGVLLPENMPESLPQDSTSEILSEAADD